MVEKLLQMLSITCNHKRTSQPFTAASASTGTHDDWDPVGTGPSHYVVCLECGKKFPYDWQKMRIVKH